MPARHEATRMTSILNSVATINYGYDGRGFFSWLYHHRGWPYQTLSARTYWRDERDRITAYQKSTANSINPMEDGRGNHYQYDAEGQLTDAWYDEVEPAGSYSSCLRQDHFYYDALGNRRSWNYVQTHGWQEFSRKDNGLNQYRMWSPFSMTNYDDDIGSPWGTPQHANGVLMQDGNITAGYNALNQPMLATSNALSPYWMFFGYDPLGRCVKRWIGGLTPEGNVPPPASNPATYLYYDGWNLIQEGSSSTDAQRQYVHGARVDEIVAQITPGNGSERYFHYDASGNCILQTYSGGGIAEQYEYDAFGYPYFYDGSGSNIGSSLWGNPFLFTGREYLKELKLYDYRARMYQPELGRFMQPDPKEFGAGDYNLYRYCHNDPVNKSDPTGLDPLAKGVLDVPANVLKNAYDNARKAAEETLKNTNRQTQVEHRIDGYRDSNGNVRSTDSTQGFKHPSPQAPPPKLPAGVKEDQRLSQGHDHVGTPGIHYGGDKASANDVANPQGAGGLPLVSAVSSTVDGGTRQEFYIPSANQAERAANAGGAYFFTSDGIKFAPAPYH
jgi:RHS repeat-associated protein